MNIIIAQKIGRFFIIPDMLRRLRLLEACTDQLAQDCESAIDRVAELDRELDGVPEQVDAAMDRADEAHRRFDSEIVGDVERAVDYELDRRMDDARRELYDELSVEMNYELARLVKPKPVDRFARLRPKRRK